MGAARLSKIGVETGSNRPHQKTLLAAQEQNPILQCYDFICEQALKLRIPIHDRICGDAVGPAYRGKIDRKIAHDPLDDLRSQPIVGGQPIAFGSGKLASGDGLRISADSDLVLHVAVS